jgi:MYXO-CTERM domain-containing protein
MDCMDNLSDPTHKCGGMCDGHAHCAYPPAGASCGTCKTCSGTGLCSLKPDDDVNCGTIDCDKNDNLPCTDYHDLTTKRCASFGACKTGTVAECTDVTNTCTTDGGSAGAGGGGTGGGTGGTTGSGGGTGTGGTGGRGPDGGAAGSTGATDGSVDGGKPKGGGGGCGCDLGGADPVTALPGLLLFAGVLTARRRRR